MQDLTAIELQTIDGGSWTDLAWAGLIVVSVLAAPLDLPVAVIAAAGYSLLT